MATLTDKLLGRERRELKIVFALVVLTLSAVLLYPLGCVLFQSILDGNGSLTLANYTSLLSEPRFWNALSNSFAVSGLSAAIAAVLAFGCAYGLHFTRLNPWARKVFQIVILLPLFLPSITYGFAVIYSFGRLGLVSQIFGVLPFSIYGFWGLLIADVIYTLPPAFLILSNAGTAFPVTFIETIRAGEQSGTLELCFDRLHKYYDKSAKTRAKLVSTLTYPVLVLIVAAIVFMVIMLFAVPMFTSAFAELGSDLPPITRGLIAVSDFFLHYWWVFVLMILAFCIVRLLLRRSDRGRMFLAAGKLKRSPLKRLHQINASAQFASTMATMLAAGLPVTRSLEVTAGVINNYLFSDSVRRVRQGVEQGRDLAGCMAADPTFPRLLTEMTGVGERSGNMEQTLTVIGDYFDNEVSVTTQRLLSLMEPVITIALAVITVILLLAVYLPMFTMYGSIA